MIILNFHDWHDIIYSMLEISAHKYNRLQYYAHAGNHTFAVVRGMENYHLLKDGFKPVLQEIQELIKKKVVEVKGEIYELDFFLGGDYKVINA